MGNTLRPRWAMALAISVPRALLGGVLGTAAGILTARLLGDGAPFRQALFVASALLVTGLLATAVQLRARPLTVLADGLVLTRDGCQISVRWRDLEAVRQRRVGLVLLEELVFREGEVRPLDAGAPFATGRAEKFRRAGVDRRIQPGLYVADWRNSPIGAGCPAC